MRFVGLTLCSAGTLLAAECFPYCDYNHNYGPYDFTYVKAGALRLSDL